MTDLKILNSIVRLPRMSDQFYKTMKRKEQEHINKQIEKNAINILSNYVPQSNPDQFFTKFIDHLDETIPKQLNSLIAASDSDGGIPNKV